MSDNEAAGSGGEDEQKEEKKFFADIAKTGRAACRKCKEKLEAGKLRLAKAGYNPFGPGVLKQWHHIDCLFEVFSKQRKTTAKIETPDDIDGWSDLDDDDRETILKHLPHCSIEDWKGTPNKAKNKDKKDPTPKKVTKKDTKKKEEDKPTFKDHKDNSFREFRRLCADIANTSNYKGKTALVKKLFTEGTDGSGFKGDLLLWCRLLLPGHVKRVYNLQSKQLVKLFSRIFGTDHDDMLEHLESGDVAETISVFFEKSDRVTPTKKSLLTLEEADQYLEQLTKVTKEDEQSNLFKTVIKRCTSNDLKMFIRLVNHDLRINTGPKHILEAVHEDAYPAFQSTYDIEAVISKVLSKSSSGASSSSKKTGLDITISVMTPVLPMLAEACKSVEMAMKKCPNGMCSEIKYDGERVQLHKKGDEYKYFSRSLKPVMPHKVSPFKDYIPQAFPHGNDLILDCEVLMIDTHTGKPLPFGTLGVHKKTAFKDANVCLFVFDCIYYNGNILTNKPFKERRKVLLDNMTEVPYRILFSEVEEIHKPKDLESMITKVLQQGLEGLVLKDLMSIYEPGKRHWLKVKKDYLFGGAMADSADLVVLGAWFGTGQKGGMMSVFLMGCFDPSRQKWYTVTKVHTGHDDKTLERLQDELQMIKISKEASKVPHWLKCTKTMIPDFVAKDPKKMPVWEITGAEFTQQHDVHTADGISIRFPRVTRIRDDKDWETATSLPELKVLFKKSKDSASFALPSAFNKDEQTDEEDEDGSKTKTPEKKSKKEKPDDIKKKKKAQKQESDDSDSESESTKGRKDTSKRKFNSSDEDEDSGGKKRNTNKRKMDIVDSDEEVEILFEKSNKGAELSLFSVTNKKEDSDKENKIVSKSGPKVKLCNLKKACVKLKRLDMDTVTSKEKYPSDIHLNNIDHDLEMDVTLSDIGKCEAMNEVLCMVKQTESLFEKKLHSMSGEDKHSQNVSDKCGEGEQIPGSEEVSQKDEDIEIVFQKEKRSEKLSDKEENNKNISDSEETVEVESKDEDDSEIMSDKKKDSENMYSKDNSEKVSDNGQNIKMVSKKKKGKNEDSDEISDKSDSEQNVRIVYETEKDKNKDTEDISDKSDSEKTLDSGQNVKIVSKNEKDKNKNSDEISNKSDSEKISDCEQNIRIVSDDEKDTGVITEKNMTSSDIISDYREDSEKVSNKKFSEKISSWEENEKIIFGNEEDCEILCEKKTVSENISNEECSEKVSGNSEPNVTVISDKEKDRVIILDRKKVSQNVSDSKESGSIEQTVIIISEKEKCSEIISDKKKDSENVSDKENSNKISCSEQNEETLYSEGNARIFSEKEKESKIISDKEKVSDKESSEKVSGSSEENVIVTSDKEKNIERKTSEKELHCEIVFDEKNNCEIIYNKVKDFEKGLDREDNEKASKIERTKVVSENEQVLKIISEKRKDNKIISNREQDSTEVSNKEYECQKLLIVEQNVEIESEKNRDSELSFEKEKNMMSNKDQDFEKVSDKAKDSEDILDIENYLRMMFETEQNIEITTPNQDSEKVSDKGENCKKISERKQTAEIVFDEVQDTVIVSEKGKGTDTITDKTCDAKKKGNQKISDKEQHDYMSSHNEKDNEQFFKFLCLNRLSDKNNGIKMLSKRKNIKIFFDTVFESKGDCDKRRDTIIVSDEDESGEIMSNAEISDKAKDTETISDKKEDNISSDTNTETLHKRKVVSDSICNIMKCYETLGEERVTEILSEKKKHTNRRGDTNTLEKEKCDQVVPDNEKVNEIIFDKEQHTKIVTDRDNKTIKQGTKISDKNCNTETQSHNEQHSELISHHNTEMLNAKENSVETSDREQNIEIIFDIRQDTEKLSDKEQTAHDKYNSAIECDKRKDTEMESGKEKNCEVITDKDIQVTVDKNQNESHKNKLVIEEEDTNVSDSSCDEQSSSRNNKRKMCSSDSSSDEQSSKINSINKKHKRHMSHEKKMLDEMDKISEQESHNSDSDKKSKEGNQNSNKSKTSKGTIQIIKKLTEKALYSLEEEVEDKTECNDRKEMSKAGSGKGLVKKNKNVSDHYTDSDEEVSRKKVDVSVEDSCSTDSDRKMIKKLKKISKRRKSKTNSDKGLVKKKNTISKDSDTDSVEEIYRNEIEIDDERNSSDSDIAVSEVAKRIIKQKVNQEEEMINKQKKISKEIFSSDSDESLSKKRLSKADLDEESGDKSKNISDHYTDSDEEVTGNSKSISKKKISKANPCKVSVRKKNAVIRDSGSDSAKEICRKKTSIDDEEKYSSDSDEVVSEVVKRISKQKVSREGGSINKEKKDVSKEKIFSSDSEEESVSRKKMSKAGSGEGSRKKIMSASEDGSDSDEEIRRKITRHVEEIVISDSDEEILAKNKRMAKQKLVSAGASMQSVTRNNIGKHQLSSVKKVSRQDIVSSSSDSDSDVIISSSEDENYSSDSDEELSKIKKSIKKYKVGKGGADIELLGKNITKHGSLSAEKVNGKKTDIIKERISSSDSRKKETKKSENVSHEKRNEMKPSNEILIKSYNLKELEIKLERLNTLSLKDKCVSHNNGPSEATGINAISVEVLDKDERTESSAKAQNIEQRLLKPQTSDVNIKEACKQSISLVESEVLSKARNSEPKMFNMEPHRTVCLDSELSAVGADPGENIFEVDTENGTPNNSDAETITLDSDFIESRILEKSTTMEKQVDVEDTPPHNNEECEESAKSDAAVRIPPETSSSLTSEIIKNNLTEAAKSHVNNRKRSLKNVADDGSNPPKRKCQTSLTDDNDCEELLKLKIENEKEIHKLKVQYMNELHAVQMQEALLRVELAKSLLEKERRNAT